MTETLRSTDNQDTRRESFRIKPAINLTQKFQAIKLYFQEIDDLAKIMQEGMDHPGTIVYRSIKKS